MTAIMSRQPENKDFGSFCRGVVGNLDVFIAAHGTFDGYARVSPAGHTRAFRSRAWQRRKIHARLAACERRGCLGKSPLSSRRLALSDSGAQSAQRSRNRGTTRGRGQSIGLAAHSFASRACSGHRARLERRAGYPRPRVRRSVAVAPLWGLSETPWHSRAFWFGAGSFDGLSNTRCSRRAAQWHRGGSQGCSSAARG